MWEWYDENFTRICYLHDSGGIGNTVYNSSSYYGEAGGTVRSKCMACVTGILFTTDYIYRRRGKCIYVGR